MKLTTAVHKYKVGSRDWVVLEWNPGWRGWDVSGKKYYWAACEIVKSRREALKKSGEYKKW